MNQFINKLETHDKNTKNGMHVIHPSSNATNNIIFESISSDLIQTSPFISQTVIFHLNKDIKIKGKFKGKTLREKEWEREAPQPPGLKELSTMESPNNTICGLTIFSISSHFIATATSIVPGGKTKRSDLILTFSLVRFASIFRIQFPPVADQNRD